MITIDDIIRTMEGADLPATPANLKTDVPLVSQGFDSLDMATLLIALEARYKKTIPLEKAARLRTLEDLVAFINA